MYLFFTYLLLSLKIRNVFQKFHCLHLLSQISTLTFKNTNTFKVDLHMMFCLHTNSITKKIPCYLFLLNSVDPQFHPRPPFSPYPFNMMGIRLPRLRSVIRHQYRLPFDNFAHVGSASMTKEDEDKCLKKRTGITDVENVICRSVFPIFSKI